MSKPKKINKQLKVKAKKINKELFKKTEFKIEPSPRTDYCGDCKMEHGFECPKVSQPKEDWMERFDKGFVRQSTQGYDDTKFIIRTAEEVKSFFSQLLEEKLAEQREESDRELEKMLADKKAHYELREKLVIKEVRAELLKEIEEKLPKKVVRLFKPEISEGSWVFKALEEGVQKIIKKQK